MYGDARHIVGDVFDLTRMQSGPHVNAEASHRLGDRTGAPDRPRRAIEDGEEPIAGRRDLSTPTSFQLAADDLVMRTKNIAPPRITERDGPLGRAHDVREQHRGEHAVRFRRGAIAGE